MGRYPILRIARGRERALTHRHPWIFSGAVAQVETPGEDAVVEIRFDDGTLVGYGHYSPNDPIRCRVFEFCDREKNINADYWRKKFSSALEYRRPFIASFTTDAYRIINGEGDGMPGIIFDRYGEVGVIQMRTPGAEALAPILTECALQSGMRHVLWRKEKGCEWLAGRKPQAPFREHGFWYVADVETGQKTGFYLDQRNHRKLAFRLAEG
ncbi:MAG: hypothetical protein RMM53_11990, partial [Bacteroidia bacterium]|nr:hypothetical protein [Bacteroidia bacterium]MDW8334928.1 hypothetical protein [Bacteroidia bacterium]